MAPPSVRYETLGRVVRLVLDRPNVLNAFDLEMRSQLVEGLARAEADESIGAVIISGAGRAFSSGVELGGLGLPPPRTAEEWRPRLELWFDLVWRIWRLRKPVIAAVNGYCVGLGCELVLAADLSIAAADARFREPEVALYSGTSPLFMPWVIGIKRTKELLLMAKTIDAPEAERIGLVNRVVPAADLQVEALSMAQEVAKSAPNCLANFKLAINRVFEIQGLETAIRYSVELSIQTLLGEPAEDRVARERFMSVNGFRAFFEKGYLASVEEGRRLLSADSDAGTVPGARPTVAAGGRE